MSPRVKTVVAAGLPVLLLAGSLYLQRTPPASGPPAPEDSGADAETLDDAVRRGARLEEDRRTVIRFLRAKKRIADLVARRRLGLREGAAAFRALDATRPERLRVPILFGGVYPGCSDEEAYCRCLIRWVRAVVRGWHADSAVVEELDAELSEGLNGPEPLRLLAVDLEQYLPPDLVPGPPGDAGQGR
jgi:hypothetical protein